MNILRAGAEEGFKRHSCPLKLSRVTAHRPDRIAPSRVSIPMSIIVQAKGLVWRLNTKESPILSVTYTACWATMLSQTTKHEFLPSLP